MARILIVDDSPSQLIGMRRTVEKLGHQVVTAEDGAAGVETAKRELPDLILMDVVMPNLNGFQATRTIAKDPKTSHIPIILVTTKDQDTDRVWGLRQGAKAYVTKPIDEAPEKGVELHLTFEKGEVVSAVTADGEPLPSENNYDILSALNVLGGEHGVGRGIHMGSTMVGNLARVGFEAPGMLILIAAHRELEKLVLSNRQQATKATLGTNTSVLTARYDPRTDTVVSICAIDNLCKGASGGAVQAANVALGLPETAGLQRVGLYP